MFFYQDIQIKSNKLFFPVNYICALTQLLVLKYVQNKDVFMRYHKAHLTRRLILDISADSEIEENMVEWLRVGTGWMTGCVMEKECGVLLVMTVHFTFH